MKIYPRLLRTSTSIKTRDKFCITFSCSKQKILITFNAEENTGLLKDWNIIWNEKFREC